MAVTVGWLARQSALGLTVVAGAAQLDREILWAHAIELADPGPYLSGGELVMTTGLNVGGRRAQQTEYVERLLAANAAALAFDTGLRYQQVPPGIIAAGDALGLPVLAVPASTPFIAITRAVIDRINADQVRAVQRTVDEQERLARETLRGGIPAVVAALARALDATVVVTSAQGGVLAGAGPDQDRVAGLVAGRRGTRSGVVADGDGVCAVQVLRAASRHRGHLAVRTDRTLSPAERLLIAHSVSLIGIELEKPVRILDAEQRLRVAVTQGLLGAPPVYEPTLLRYFGFDPADAVLVLVVADTGPALTAQATVQQVLHKTGMAFLMCPRENGIVVVLPAAERDAVAEIHHALGRQSGRDLVVAVSSAGDVADLPVLLAQAAAAGRSTGGGSLRWFERLGLLGAVLGDRTPAELAVLAETLRPLDAEDLVSTLSAFLESNGHLESAAATLGVHRHTIRNRLGRIGELLGLPLDSADTRAALVIALHARRLLGGADGSAR